MGEGTPTGRRGPHAQAQSSICEGFWGQEAQGDCSTTAWNPPQGPARQRPGHHGWQGASVPDKGLSGSSSGEQPRGGCRLS